MSDGIAPETKAEIALAVRRALAEHGYERLTTAKIAAEYDKSEAGLYYYFDTKDEMIAAFLEHTAGQLGEDLAAIGEGDPERQLRAACEHLFLSPGDAEAGVHVAIMELLSHAPYNETLRDPLLALESATLDALTGIVRDGVERGVFRDVDPRATAAFLLAAADGSTGFHVALEMDVGEDLQRGWSAYVDSLLADGE
ncbi:MULTISPECIES: TetR/AcrR family transcriptional regulator [Salinibaculum]|uniref:TetR/AcrR family transcriptional regulator n=1 Tax=Salinibaculum TaxID=2732368 RepID=UPI0030CEB976